MDSDLHNTNRISLENLPQVASVSWRKCEKLNNSTARYKLEIHVDNVGWVRNLLVIVGAYLASSGNAPLPPIDISPFVRLRNIR